jgi:hypothetical protein
LSPAPASSAPHAAEPGALGRAARSRVGHTALWVAFAACVAFRAWHVFHNSPLDHLFSDPHRHWHNGRYFFWPSVMGSIDPIGYQVWLKALQWADPGSGIVVLAATGALSAALPAFYLLALREVLPIAWALAGALAIGFMPSLLTIYSFFMTETLLLTVAACGFWLTLRAMRTPSFPMLAGIALAWAVAAYTRLAAVPLAALCFVALACTLRWRKTLALAAAYFACFGAIALPACWHSTRNLNFCAPFGSTYFAEIVRASSFETMRMQVVNRGEWEFISPSLLAPPLEPLSDWRSLRSGIGTFTVDLAHGRRDWEEALRTFRERGPRLPWTDDRIENAVMLFFDRSWPDADDLDSVWGRLNGWTRWLWLPLTLAVALLAVRARPSLRVGLIPYAALALVALLLVQGAAVMEGRYRKPVEPLLIAGAFILVHRVRSRGGVPDQAGASPVA